MATKQKQQTLPQQGRALRKLKERRDTAKKAFDDLDTQHAKAQSEYIERMKSEGVSGIKIDGRNLVPAQTEYSSINDLSEFIAWAEMEAPELIKLAANKEQLNALVRQRLDDDEPLPPGVTFYVREYISDRAG